MIRKEGVFLIGITVVFLLSFSSQGYPLVDVASSSDQMITFTVQSIRGFDDFNTTPTPQFFMNITMNDAKYVSPIWNTTRYLYNINWTVTLPITDKTKDIIIAIQLWDHQDNGDFLCDLNGYNGSSPEDYAVNIIYNTSNGHWTGDDYIGDPSGYGRLNGCDDGSIYTQERDCELWFDIKQTNTMNNGQDDPNHDGIPLWWDWKYGYDPYADDNHSKLDPDKDGLDNHEEYLTSQWGSDPFRQDLFIEIDHMAESPRGESSILPNGSKELLRTAYDRHNIVYHLDDGCMDGGGEIVPFQEITFRPQLHQIYQQYFLHGNQSNWRRGVFHYGVILYNHVLIKGYVFSGEKTPFFAPGVNSFQISSKRMVQRAKNPKADRDLIYASAIMHETGHTLGINAVNTPGCDNSLSKYPWQINWYRYRNYHSVMNYRYIYTMLDYSDGSHGRNDFDDWGFIDLTYFQRLLT